MSWQRTRTHGGLRPSWTRTRHYNKTRTRTWIHVVGLAQGVDFAVRLYRQMIDAGCNPNTATFNTIVKLFYKEGRFKEGYAFVQQVHKAGCKPDVLTNHCFFQYLSRPQEVLGLFEKMLEWGCKPRMDTYVMLIKGLQVFIFLGYTSIYVVTSQFDAEFSFCSFVNVVFWIMCANYVLTGRALLRSCQLCVSRIWWGKLVFVDKHIWASRNLEYSF